MWKLVMEINKKEINTPVFLYRRRNSGGVRSLYREPQNYVPWSSYVHTKVHQRKIRQSYKLGHASPCPTEPVGNLQFAHMAF